VIWIRRLMFKHLSPFLPPLLLAPITRMVAAPPLHALDLIGTAEVIPVAVFTEPAALAGGLTGPLTRLQGAEPLASLDPGMRMEQSLAASALPSFR
jgi:hypothetical protein